jgi:HSP20 family protein
MSERARAGQAGAAVDGAAAAGAGLFGAPLREFLTRLAEAAEALGGDGTATARHAGEVPFSIGDKQASAVFGYTVRMGLDGLRAEPFGDVQAPSARGDGTRGDARAAPAGRGAAARAPIVDVFDEGPDIRIVAELPGVAAEDVLCALEGNTLRIEATGAHAYLKTVALPRAVDTASLRWACRNGILEVHVRGAGAA